MSEILIILWCENDQPLLYCSYSRGRKSWFVDNGHWHLVDLDLDTLTGRVEETGDMCKFSKISLAESGEYNDILDDALKNKELFTDDRETIKKLLSELKPYVKVSVNDEDDEIPF